MRSLLFNKCLARVTRIKSRKFCFRIGIVIVVLGMIWVISHL